MILMKVTDKFTEALNNIMREFSKLLSETMNDKLATITVRLDNIEKRFDSYSARYTLDEPLPASTPASDAHNCPLANCRPGVSTVIEAASRTLLEFEYEKEEIRKRARNVIITGLSKQNHMTDIALVESFCETNLTVKPHVIAARRIGKNRTEPTAKLCVTLENEAAVTDLIQSATLLRSSSDVSINRIFFNRDLTRMQADAAYKKRCENRAKLNPQPASFQPTS